MYHTSHDTEHHHFDHKETYEKFKNIRTFYPYDVYKSCVGTTMNKLRKDHSTTKTVIEESSYKEVITFLKCLSNNPVFDLGFWLKQFDDKEKRTKHVYCPLGKRMELWRHQWGLAEILDSKGDSVVDQSESDDNSDGGKYTPVHYAQYLYTVRNKSIFHQALYIYMSEVHKTDMKQYYTDNVSSLRDYSNIHEIRR